VPDWLEQVHEFWPATAVPSGATTKKNLDGTIRHDAKRTTVDYSWPVPGIPLADQVCSPNATIDMNALPAFEWFQLRRFHEQTWYLKALNLGPIECAKFDWSAWYRQFALIAAAVPSHLQLFCDELDGPHLVADSAMVFGDATAANVASRLSGLVVWLMHLIADRI
jgi:hypothetical protein